MTLDPTTRMGLRAGAATLAAVGLTHVLPLERPYWVILTAVILVNETWGESARKAAQRLATTALGCVTGGLLYLLTDRVPAAQPAFLLAGVFLAVYFRTGVPAGSYVPMTFFITVYVVFLFAVLGDWTAELMWARVIDTAVGGLIALAISRLVLPQRAVAQWAAEWAELWAAARGLFEGASRALATGAPPAAAVDRTDLLKRIERLHAVAAATAYEEWTWRGSRAEPMPLARAEHVCRYVLALAALADDPDVRSLGRRFAAHFGPAATGIAAALGCLADGDEPPGDPARLLDPSWIAADPVRLGPIAAVLGELVGLLGDDRPGR